MERLYEIFDIKLRNTPMKFKRFLFHQIDWGHRLISIQGARGAGKTTLVMQHVRQQFKQVSKLVLFVDVNHIFFTTNSLLDLADQFYKKGGKFLFLDEIHKYSNWSVENKQIYDTYSDLNVVVTGSSILEIKKGEADLSRRVVSYLLPGLSFREFLELNNNLKFESFDLPSILNSHMEISQDISSETRPLEFFDDYLKYGYYPYFAEGKEVYPEKLNSTINLILEVDLPAVERVDFINIQKIKRLLSIISHSTPFKPNTHKLSLLTEVSRPTLIRFFTLLEKAQLLSLLQASTKGIRKMAKPDKIFLNNTNLMYAIAPDNLNKGTLRETFFYNQTNYDHKVELPKAGDFLLDNQYTFEVGGRNKTMAQIAGIDQAWIVADDIESGYNTKIPLWLFGFMY